MKHKRFIYHGYSIDESGFEYHFSLDEYTFRPRWTFSSAAIAAFPRNDALLQKLIFNLGMVELISYWKAACPPVVEVRCGKIDDWQIAWWKKLYRNGLGEFFYTNNIIPDDNFMTIVPMDTSPPLEDTGIHAVKPDTPDSSHAIRSATGCLIPVGGGKDSIVTLELLRENMEDSYCYIVGDIKRAVDSAKMAGYPDSRIIQVKRKIDPMLLELNKKGYLNGHTPFSAIIAFSSLIFAYLSGKKYIVLSNESSANEGNVAESLSGGLEVNHQYSKSTEFEKDFREYVIRLNPELPSYFSLLRPWNELQITKVFTQYPQYFSVFQSCNAGTKSNTWCCKCAKCLYVYVMLSAFLDDNVLIKIFGENLLKNPDLKGMLVALTDSKYNKPFECVGTREEINLALSMSAKRRKDTLPKAVSLPHFWDSDHFVPEEFLSLLKNFYKNT